MSVELYMQPQDPATGTECFEPKSSQAKPSFQSLSNSFFSSCGGPYVPIVTIVSIVVPFVGLTYRILNIIELSWNYVYAVGK